VPQAAISSPTRPPTAASTTLSVRQLLHQAQAAAAHRRPDGDLAVPRGSPGEQEIRHVRTADEQHEPDRTQQHEQRRPDVAHDPFGERNAFRLPAQHRRITVGIARGEPPGQGEKLWLELDPPSPPA